jgi:hypothetical protein
VVSRVASSQLPIPWAERKLFTTLLPSGLRAVCPRRTGNGPDFVEHHCTCRVVLVERISEPVAGDEVPVIVTV